MVKKGKGSLESSDEDEIKLNRKGVHDKKKAARKEKKDNPKNNKSSKKANKNDSSKKNKSEKKHNNKASNKKKDDESESSDDYINALESKILPGQKFTTPSKGDPVRAFYESMLKQKPNSEMALKHCIEYGILNEKEAEEGIKKLNKLSSKANNEQNTNIKKDKSKGK